MPRGSRETRKVVRDSHSTHSSFVSHQVFGGGDESSAREEPMPLAAEPEEEEAPDIDHPRMRTSMDSEMGLPFLSSPLGSAANLEGSLHQHTDSNECTAKGM